MQNKKKSGETELYNITFDSDYHYHNIDNDIGIYYYYYKVIRSIVYFFAKKKIENKFFSEFFFV